MLEQSKNITFLLRDYLIENGIDTGIAGFINLAVNLLILLLIFSILRFLSKKLIIRLFNAFSNQTKTTFDDFLVQGNFPRFVANIPPLLLLIFTVPIIFEELPYLLNILEKLLDISLIILSVLICRSLLRSSQNYLKTSEEYKDKPLESYIQVLMIFAWAIGFVFIFSEISGRSPINFLISLGAASAVILLIFKDTILGFVASVQVTANDIVRIGDWISFDKYGADGFVTEINLATVRVQNWDMTYTTIPTYNLIGDSFQNWRGMQESPGRRIKRSLYIKQNSIKFVTESDIEKYRSFQLIAPYLKERQIEIDTFNREKKFDKNVLINGRNQTNLGVFRRYADAYLREHPFVNKDLTLMVRHLAPTTQGIPLEIYCFSSDKRWEYYEQITADIFDHLIAAIPFFDLQLFESPSGDDIVKSLKSFSKE